MCCMISQSVSHLRKATVTSPGAKTWLPWYSITVFSKTAPSTDDFCNYLYIYTGLCRPFCCIFALLCILFVFWRIHTKRYSFFYSRLYAIEQEIIRSRLRDYTNSNYRRKPSNLSNVGIDMENKSTANKLICFLKINYGQEIESADQTASRL